MEEFIKVQGYLKQTNMAGVAEQGILLWNLFL
jgi:hypothetical protein